MLDRGLTMDDINFAIKNSYRDKISCVFSDYNDENLIFRLRLSNPKEKKKSRFQLKLEEMQKQQQEMLKNKKR